MIIFRILSLLPLNIISRAFGGLASIGRGTVFQRLLISGFRKLYKIDLSIAVESSFLSLQELFMRDLIPESRPVGGALVSPVDGRLTQSGEVVDGRILQVKGREYSVASFLQDEEKAGIFNGGRYLTFYLSPPDYHHIHAPCEMEISSVTHIPGALFPVNALSVNNVPDLFCRNERVAIHFRVNGKEGVLVLVGATNVGSIALSFMEIVTNRPGSSLRRIPTSHSVSKGERVGSFRLGSSVVLLLQAGAAMPNRELGPVRFGETLEQGS